MKYLITLLLAFSFNALAITQSFTLDTGTTQSTYTGVTKGVVDHFSKDYSHSVQGNMKSEKLDRIDGTKNVTTNFGGISNKHYVGAYANMNGADFSYKHSSTSYSGNAFTNSKDVFVNDGFERNTKSGPHGGSVEHSKFSGSYVTERNETENTSGTSTTTERSWY
ncbi:hypothetical protein VPH219E481_0030 [Vibrio phage 219E48-1]|nr:hypothetical protein PODOV021v1_p0017 [Vibrio phage 219E41.2]QZI91025.1 hypothetical protein PODOV032v1_p0020 [Vibrio phage 219E41.1]QZI91158.1 hypothetical protein PODOV060v1_p0064 [Vibrio phage 234P8]QZI91549.1 hypothetical protein PODOV087v1_p0044 [Vibrio phage 431E45.1]QZI91590.1 hypothetical protein PODOV086v1_p0006 [Vibrio phage 431E46.1]QZI91700.1 hypothetical protein PODOV088v1_p0039 [Vibrio phage 431E48.2]